VVYWRTMSEHAVLVEGPAGCQRPRLVSAAPLPSITAVDALDPTRCVRMTNGGSHTADTGYAAFWLTLGMAYDGSACDSCARYCGTSRMSVCEGRIHNAALATSYDVS